MLFHSSIRKELARSFVATLVVLITVVMSMMLIRTLGLASKGSVNPQDVIMLMGYSVLGHMSTIMTISLFIAVTNTISRMYRDSEMAVWFASGKGLGGFIGPVLRFAWPILLAIAVLALVVWPWTAQQTIKLRSQYEQRSDLERVSAGQFQENASGSRVFFVEASEKDTTGIASGSSRPPLTSDTFALAASKQVRNVFISSTEHGKQIITSSRNGRLETINGDQFLLLSQGQRIEQSPGKADIKISEFEEYGVLVNAAKLSSQVTLPAKSLNTWVLVSNPTPLNMAELSWRVGLALCAFNLMFLALLLAAVNPRAGRGFGMAFALLTFIVYNNLLYLGYSRIANGRVDFVSWMIALHGSVLALTLLWMIARHTQWSWRHLLPRSVSTKPLAA